MLDRICFGDVGDMVDRDVPLSFQFEELGLSLFEVANPKRLPRIVNYRKPAGMSQDYFVFAKHEGRGLEQSQLLDQVVQVLRRGDPALCELELPVSQLPFGNLWLGLLTHPK